MSKPTKSQIDYVKQFGYEHSPSAIAATTESARNTAMMAEWQMFMAGDMDEYAQRFHLRAADPDGDVGPATIATLAQPRCGFPDFFDPDNPPGLVGTAVQGANIPESCRQNITWQHDIRSLRGLTAAEIDAYHVEAFQNLMDALEVGFVRTSRFDDAIFQESKAPLSNGILAQHLLAYNECARVWGQMNSNVNWNSGDRQPGKAPALPVATFTHEAGHGLGMHHTPRDRSSTMYPSIGRESQQRRGKFNRTDISEALRIGYRERTTPIPDPPPGPQPPGKIILRSTNNHDGSITTRVESTGGGGSNGGEGGFT